MGHDFKAALQRLTSVQQDLNVKIPQCCERPLPLCLGKGDSQNFSPSRLPVCPGFLRPLMTSLASVPVDPATPHCFVPSTTFKRIDGSFVSAAHLVGSGGERIQGPGGSSVLVLRVNRIESARRELVRIQANHCTGTFVITPDHRLEVAGLLSEQPQQMEAQELVQQLENGAAPLVHDGIMLHQIRQASRFFKDTGLVQVWFEADASVLVWIRPRRNFSVPCPSIAARGEHPNLIQTDLLRSQGVTIANGFLDDVPEPQTARRSRSSGSRPDPLSRWSVGSRRHHIGQCEVCPRQHRYLFDASKFGPANIAPCPHGAACHKCHEWHPTFQGRLRRR